MLQPAVLATLASPRRREILRLVWREERPAGGIHDAMPDVTFGAVSQHLRALADAGLVACRAEGRRRYYRARPAALGPLAGELERFWDDALGRLKVQAELHAARRGPRPGRRPATPRRRPQ
ncbi:MAG: metalloregulator ArsR/SmtB family transcription factor [Vicinamibacterales bacterium]